MSACPLKKSAAPTRLEQVLAAGIAANPPRPANPDGVLNDENLNDYIAMQIAESDKMAVKDLCESLRSWCSTQRVRCGENVYKVACGALGIRSRGKDGLEDVNYVNEMIDTIVGRMDRSFFASEFVTLPNDFDFGPWKTMFMRLCRMYSAMHPALVAEWGRVIMATRGQDPERSRQMWMQSRLFADWAPVGGDIGDRAAKTEMGIYNEELAGYLFRVVADVNLGETASARRAFDDGYMAMLRQVQKAFQLHSWDEIVRLLTKNNLTHDSYCLSPFDRYPNVRLLDYIITDNCSDLSPADNNPVTEYILQDPAYNPYKVVTINPVTEYILQDPAYNPYKVEPSGEIPHPPLINMAVERNMTDRFTLSFRARLAHPLAHLALRYRARGDYNLNVFHLMLETTPDTFPQGKKWERIKKAYMKSWKLKMMHVKDVLDRVDSAPPENPTLMQTLLRSKAYVRAYGDEPLTPLELFRAVYKNWETRLIGARSSVKEAPSEDVMRETFGTEIYTGMVRILEAPMETVKIS